MSHTNAPRPLVEFWLRSEPGLDRVAADIVLAAVAPLELPQLRLEQLGMAVAEAVANGMEHGNAYAADLPVVIEVIVAPEALTVRVSDCGVEPLADGAPTPDLDAKLAGDQSPRGWGMFLMRSLVDELHVRCTETGNTVELVVNLNPLDEKGSES